MVRRLFQGEAGREGEEMNRICIVFNLLENGRKPELPHMVLRHFYTNKYSIPNAEQIGQEVDWNTNTWRMYLSHPMFPEYNGTHEMISYEDARIRYRFLFADTNPLLYKKFYIRISIILM